MAGNVGNNPDELEAFVNQVQDYIEHITDETTNISSKYEQMADVWTDSKYMEFGEALSELNSQMQAFCEKTRDHVPHLSAMVQKLREYQQLGV